MLIFEARNKKILQGICSESAKIICKQELFNSSIEPLTALQSFLHTHNYIPSKVALTIAPCDPSQINPVLNYLSVIYTKSFKCQIRPVHHLDAHLSFCRKPFLALIASGTSTDLVLYRHKSYEVLGISIDMQLGQAYHMISKELNLPLSQWDNLNETETIPFPSPMDYQETLDFSFRGTYLYTLQHIYPRSRFLSVKSPLLDPCFHRENKQTASILVNSFRLSIEEQLTNRVTKAMKMVKSSYPEVKSFVACN